MINFRSNYFVKTGDPGICVMLIPQVTLSINTGVELCSFVVSFSGIYTVHATHLIWRTSRVFS